MLFDLGDYTFLVAGVIKEEVVIVDLHDWPQSLFDQFCIPKHC